MTTPHEALAFLPHPSFVEGMARMLDLGGSLRNRNDGGPQRDLDSAALLSDWIATGDDLRVSIDFYGERIGHASTR